MATAMPETPTEPTKEPISFPFHKFPADLFATIMASSPDPTRLYLILIALNHSFRRILRGCPKTLFFRAINFGEMMGENQTSDEYIRAAACVPTGDSLGAILGPCAQLEVLEFAPERAVLQCGKDPDQWRPWVDRAFPAVSPHPRLHTLCLPSLAGLAEGALCTIIERVGPRLSRLTLGSVDMPVSPLVESALCRWCPRLQHLRVALAEGGGDPTCAAVLRCFPELRTAEVGRGMAGSRPPGGEGPPSLEPGVRATLPHLTRLNGWPVMTTPAQDAKEESGGATEAATRPTAVVVDGELRVDCRRFDSHELRSILLHEGPTLRRVWLEGVAPDGIMDDLPAMGRLTDLRLSCVEEPRLDDALLSSLAVLHLTWRECHRTEPWLIASRSLRELSLEVLTTYSRVSGGAVRKPHAVMVDCPRLEQLHVPAVVATSLEVQSSLRLNCPALRQAWGLGHWGTVTFECPMPDLRLAINPMQTILEQAHLWPALSEIGSLMIPASQLDDLLGAGSPLRALTVVRGLMVSRDVSQVDLHALPGLRQLGLILNVTNFNPGQPQLTFVDRFRLHAPGLVALKAHMGPTRALALEAPMLRQLSISGGDSRTPMRFAWLAPAPYQLAQLEMANAMLGPPQEFYEALMGGDVGSGLRALSIPLAAREEQVVHVLETLISRLPQLRSLRLCQLNPRFAIPQGSCPITIRSPSLISLAICRSRVKDLQLDCPRLEDLTLVECRFGEFTVGAAPYLVQTRLERTALKTNSFDVLAQLQQQVE
ncbi:hypothetical protein PAPYR_9195 [Paratrimastix pyriformis]|uniref:F-box domain-containing protein n=1 Tax=Paratrimastix pyriformis TaxID=342808 RepID=A0ABQ8U8Y4_9EUKA|nr:hypothetical protein PAPYR_9195 [Paratrimastix pyriformis]